MSGIFDIKKGLDIVIVIETGSSKTILFQGISIAIKGEIMLVISPILTLIVNQLCGY